MAVALSLFIYRPANSWIYQNLKAKINLSRTGPTWLKRTKHCKRIGFRLKLELLSECTKHCTAIGAMDRIVYFATTSPKFGNTGANTFQPTKDFSFVFDFCLVLTMIWEVHLGEWRNAGDRMGKSRGWIMAPGKRRMDIQKDLGNWYFITL